MCSSPKPPRKFAIDTLNIWVITKIYEKCHQTAHKSVAIPKQCVTKPSISFREKKKKFAMQRFQDRQECQRILILAPLRLHWQENDLLIWNVHSIIP